MTSSPPDSHHGPSLRKEEKNQYVSISEKKNALNLSNLNSESLNNANVYNTAMKTIIKHLSKDSVSISYAI